MKSLAQCNFPITTSNGKKKTLKEQGNITPDFLHKIITKKNGKPDLLAISIYVEARSWFKPKKTKANGNVIYSSKLKGYGWQVGYEYFVKKHHCSSDLIRTKFVLLEKLGLLKRTFKTEYFYGKRFNNLMYLLVWKDTPHFYSETGLEKSATTTLENQGYLYLNSRTPILENKDNIYVIPNNHLIEELESSKSFLCSSIKEIPVIEGNKTRVREAESKTLPCANGSMSEPAQDEFAHNKTEIVEATEEPKAVQAVTFCNQLNQRQFPRLLTATEEKTIHLQRAQRAHANTEESSFAELMSRVLDPTFQAPITQEPDYTEPTLANDSMNEPAKVLTSTEPRLTLEQTEVMKQEKIYEIGNEETNKMLLSKAIFNTFGEEAANKIQDNCEFMFLSEGKLRIKLKPGITLEEQEKTKLRACIKAVYGEDVKMVSDVPKMIITPKPWPILAATTSHSVTKSAAVVFGFPQGSQWPKFKTSLTRCFNARHESKYTEHIIKNWYEKLRVSSESSNKSLVLVGDGCVIDRITQDYLELTEAAVLASGIDIEMRYESNRQKPLLISKETINYWKRK